MAKIMVFNVPAYGHVNVTLPVVHELVERGHDVLYYCGDRMCDVIQKTGATYKRCPDVLPTSHDISGKAHNLANISVMLLNACETLVPFVMREIEQEQPDVVLYDTINLWARIATHVTQTPAIVSFPITVAEGVKGLMDFRTTAYAVLSALPKIPKLLQYRSKLMKTYGSEALAFPLFPSFADLNLVFSSREFQMDTPFLDESFRFVGASIHPEMRADAPLHLPDDLPLIYVSLGTINNQNLDFYRGVIQAFADYPARIVLSIGQQMSKDEFRPIPENFTVMNSVPQLNVLQQAAVFVTHGGMNSIQESLYYGVPMVIVPQQIEQAINGKRVQELGAGQVIGAAPPYGNVNIDKLVDAVNAVFKQPIYKSKAMEQRDYSRNSGGYPKAVDEIERFIAHVDR